MTVEGHSSQRERIERPEKKIGSENKVTKFNTSAQEEVKMPTERSQQKLSVKSEVPAAQRKNPALRNSQEGINKTEEKGKAKSQASANPEDKIRTNEDPNPEGEDQEQFDIQDIFMQPSNTGQPHTNNFNNINIQNEYKNIIHIDNQELLRDLLLTSPRTIHKAEKKGKIKKESSLAKCEEEEEKFEENDDGDEDI